MSRVGFLALIGAVALASGAQAGDQPQALHDKAFYVANAAVRVATLKACYSDESYAHLYDCRNAADAEDLVWSQRLSKESNFLADPSYWQQHPAARHGPAVICARGSGAAYPMFAPYCPLIMAAEVGARK